MGKLGLTNTHARVQPSKPPSRHALLARRARDRDGRAAALDAGARAALEAARLSHEARRSPGEGHERLLGMCDALLKELDGGR